MTVRILEGDVRDRLADLPDGSVQCCVTSPPYYGLRDYGVAGQLGLEPTLAEYIANMVAVFRDVRRVLRDDGTLWLNIGDSYASTGGVHASGSYDDAVGRAMSGVPRLTGGLKPKDLMMVPARLALALQDDGWYLRSDIIWHKPNPMPESVTDRPTSAHEHIFLLTKRKTYYYDADAIREPLAASSVARLNQDVDAQEGSHRANGGAKTNGTMKAVSKQDGVGRSTYVGFNARYDESPVTGGANCRNVWSIATMPYKNAHFATFPPEIPRRCILAGTSEKGCCAACGAPWVRDTEHVGDAQSRWSKTNALAVEVGGTHRERNTTRIMQTLGWSPSCACDADIVPCTVLDPFLGSGTTLLVADRLGRHGVGIELNPEYAAMARKRIVSDAPLLVEIPA